MKLGNQQQIAYDKIMAWQKSPGQRIFTLGGYAGTGKSTIAKNIGDQFDKVIYCAFTGKAALNLRQKGMSNACTIHRLIYTPVEGSKPVRFKLSPEKIIGADLIIIDEYSMVNDRILNDLFAVSSCKILALGDPGQLPPVEGTNTLSPDYVLTEVFRQALENPVLAAATFVRENDRLPLETVKNDHGCFARVRMSKLSHALYEERFDQILTDTNRSRAELNGIMRAARGYTDIEPRCNDKVICLTNKYDYDVYNGQIGVLKTVEKSALVRRHYTSEIIFPECEKLITYNGAPFFGEETLQGLGLPPYFDYAYAITVHKAQGSEWDSVGITSTKSTSKEWLYTAITRARKNCAILY